MVCFGQVKPHGVWTITELLYRFRLQTSLLTNDNSKLPAFYTSSLLGSELSAWVERCAERRLFLTDHLI
ncbi:hypothetical protein PybrP1_011869 [[Pythium] brassicae (nom. inval.)]|nr:hypothetical protein PybrP1_011869 [[Pythium] brassicae (nom. inval.)]